MTRERFEELAQAYGGDIARWPAGEREAAALLMTGEPEVAAGALAAAAELDAALDACGLEPASVALIEAIVASAPAPRRARRWRAWLLPAGLAASLAAACVAGVLAGVELGRHAVGGSDTAVAADTGVASAAAELDASGLASEDV